jgi:hypothetical protein
MREHSSVGWGAGGSAMLSTTLLEAVFRAPSQIESHGGARLVSSRPQGAQDVGVRALPNESMGLIK